MHFNLISTITDHNIDTKKLAERVIVGPQESVLKDIECFNDTYHSDIRCTKRFRWEPGFYKKLKKLMLQNMKLDQQPKSVKSAFYGVMNHRWRYNQLEKSIQNIDGKLYALRSNNMMFQDNFDIVKEKCAEWFNGIVNTSEAINNEDNGYTFNIYHSNDLNYSRKEYLVFIIEIDGLVMNIETDAGSVPLKCGKVKMFVALDMLQVICASISETAIRFNNQYQHHGYMLGGQYQPLTAGLLFPYISSSVGMRTIVFDKVIDSYKRYEDNSHINYDNLSQWEDPYAGLCLGDLQNQVLNGLASGRLDEAMFWLTKWGSVYSINHTGPLNNYSSMYHGKPAMLYSDALEGVLTDRDSRNCDYILPERQSEAYCETMNCLLKDTCLQYEEAYTTIDDETNALREQILANYLIGRDELYAQTLRPYSTMQYIVAINDMNSHWTTADRYISRLHANIILQFRINVNRESMHYIMATACSEVDYLATIEDMGGYTTNEEGFKLWLNDHYVNRTIEPEIYPLSEEGYVNEPGVITHEGLEAELLEHYSATGRGIPIQITERG